MQSGNPKPAKGYSKRSGKSASRRLENENYQTRYFTASRRAKAKTFVDATIKCPKLYGGYHSPMWYKALLETIDEPGIVSLQNVKHWVDRNKSFFWVPTKSSKKKAFDEFVINESPAPQTVTQQREESNEGESEEKVVRQDETSISQSQQEVEDVPFIDVGFTPPRTSAGFQIKTDDEIFETDSGRGTSEEVNLPSFCPTFRESNQTPQKLIVNADEVLKLLKATSYLDLVEPSGNPNSPEKLALNAQECFLISDDKVGRLAFNLDEFGNLMVKVGEVESAYKRWVATLVAPNNDSLFRIDNLLGDFKSLLDQVESEHVHHVAGS